MNETRRTNRLGMVTLLGIILGVGILFAGCDKAPQDERKPATKGETKTKATEASPPESNDQPSETLVEEIAATDNFFKWFEIRTKYRESGERNEETEAALAAKEHELHNEGVLGTMDGSLELVAFDWQIQDENTGEGEKAKFLAKWLFYTKKQVNLDANQAAKLILRFHVDKSHEAYFSESSHPHWFNASIMPTPAVTEWEAGTYHLVERPVTAVLVPYRQETFFSVLTTEEQYVLRLGGKTEGVIDLGWRNGLLE